MTDNIVNNLTNGPLRDRATGGIVTEGMTLVGELGPELVRLPFGSEVFPTGTGPTGGGFAGGGATTHNHHNVYALTAPDLHILIQKAEAGADVAHNIATEMSAQGFG